MASDLTINFLVSFRSMGGGNHNASRLAKYCHKEKFALSFQSFNTCYKVRSGEIIC